MGATDIKGRMATSVFGCAPFPPSFLSCLDIPKGGVLFAIPALLASGLLNHTNEYFQLPSGFYRLDSIFLLLAFTTLARVKCIDYLRLLPPGEWGKLLGTDRCPEVRTLREKLKILTQEGNPEEWAGELCRDWMAADPQLSGILYVDGHVRVYTGKQTELPRHYVSRMKLAARATTDYWVNAMDGQPFFVVNKDIDPGLIQVLQEDILPRLVTDLPEQLMLFDDGDPDTHRFMLVFDREGYSPAFMADLRKEGIACMTYNKYPGDDWPKNEFKEQVVTLAAGNEVKMKLAERELSSIGKVELKVREIRKLNDSGKQTSILSTNYQDDKRVLAPAMFARWSQENFFKYMKKNYNIDRLADYSLEDISETKKVVNPQYRDILNIIRKKAAKLGRAKKCFADVQLSEIDPKEVEEYQLKKAALREEIMGLEKELADLKECRKGTPNHVMFFELPEEDQHQRLGTSGKYFIDTIKMIAYRAETIMVGIVRDVMRRADEARALVSAIYETEADILPDYEKKILKVRLHQLANRSTANTISHLCSELNATRTIFPGSDLRLVYEIISAEPSVG